MFVVASRFVMRGPTTIFSGGNISSLSKSVQLLKLLENGSTCCYFGSNQRYRDLVLDRMRDHFSTNLKHLCCHYRSISEICRRLKINRGQFGKYLSGDSFPTSYNLKRICDFFGVEGYEIALPADQFASLLSDRHRPVDPAQITAPQRAIERLGRYSSTRMETLIGRYREYMRSPAHKHVLCSLVEIKEENGQYVYVRDEPSIERRDGCADVAYHRYEGIAYYLGDRLFLIDYEYQASSEINLTILVPNFRGRNDRINGLKMGVTACDRRAPMCSQVVWEFLAKGAGHADAPAVDREHHEHDTDLDADLRSRLSQAQLIDGIFRLF